MLRLTHLKYFLSNGIMNNGYTRITKKSLLNVRWSLNVMSVAGRDSTLFIPFLTPN